MHDPISVKGTSWIEDTSTEVADAGGGGIDTTTSLGRLGARDASWYAGGDSCGDAVGNRFCTGCEFFGAGAAFHADAASRRAPCGSARASVG